MSKQSKSFVIQQLLREGYEEDPESPLLKMKFVDLLNLRKMHLNKKLKELEDSDSDSDADESKTKEPLPSAEIKAKLRERRIEPTASLFDLFSNKL
jgi:hypothetical protein